VIISASRRTDIPALYSQWFMNRVSAGWCAVRNPRNAGQVSRVSLAPEDVDCIVFWSKNPAPMLPHLDELDRRRLRYYFQYSLNDYPGELEPGVPPLDRRVRTFLDLAGHVGPLRLIWRYDPVIISSRTPADFHSERFARIAGELRGATRRVMLSVLDFYRKTDRRLTQLEQEGFLFDRQAASSADTIELLRHLAAIARGHDMEVFTCAEGGTLNETGIPPGRCIDEQLLNTLWGLNLRYVKDPAQRELCLCMLSKDIGMNNTCIHGCPYCYATGNQALAQRRHQEHDPGSTCIWGNLELPRAMQGQQQRYSPRSSRPVAKQHGR
jgi:hypothetical protein